MTNQLNALKCVKWGKSHTQTRKWTSVQENLQERSGQRRELLNGASEQLHTQITCLH